MSRWGVAALAVAVATVIAIGMVAIRLSDRSTSDAPTGASDSAAPASTSPQPQRSSGDDPSRGRDPETAQRRSATGQRALRAQLRRLKHSLDRRDRKAAGDEFYVTVSLRKPIPLPIADRRRTTPLPRELPATTVYSIYTETAGTPHRIRTKNLDRRGARVTGVPRRRLVVLGMSLPVRDYRAVRRELRTLPIGDRDVGLAAGGAKYVPDTPFGDRALRSWARSYRRS